jgi:hypothetical protein
MKKGAKEPPVKENERKEIKTEGENLKKTKIKAERMCLSETHVRTQREREREREKDSQQGPLN